MKLLKLIVVIAIVSPMMVSAQCKSFTKKQCLPLLDAFVPSSNFNSAVMMPGDEADLMMTFYAGQEYRLFVCSEDIIGELNFEVQDEQSTLFASADNENPYFDFKMQNTKQLKLKIIVPEQENPNRMVHQGCATVMVGSKP